MKLAVGLLVLSLFAAACYELPDGRDEHSTTPLMRAAAAGDVAAVRSLIDDGAEIDARVKPHPSGRVFMAFISFMQELPDRNPGWTALTFAVSGGHVEAARVLLERGADPNVETDSGLRPLDLVIVSRRTDPQMMRVLVQHGASVNPTRPGNRISPLVVAASLGDVDLVRLMLARGALLNSAGTDAQTPLMAAAAGGHHEMADLLIAAGADRNAQDGNGWTAARHALVRGDTALAERIGGADWLRTEKGSAQLLGAVAAGELPAIRRALAGGADVNARDRHGRSVLVNAAGDAPEAAVLYLLANGAQMRGDEIRSLTYLSVVRGFVILLDTLIARGVPMDDDLVAEAARMGHPKIIQRLAEHGLDIAVHNDAPLRQAAIYGQLESARTLLKLGARWDTPDRTGTTALREACTRHRSDIVKLFANAGADTTSAAAGCVKPTAE